MTIWSILEPLLELFGTYVNLPQVHILLVLAIFPKEPVVCWSIHSKEIANYIIDKEEGILV